MPAGAPSPVPDLTAGHRPSSPLCMRPLRTFGLIATSVAVPIALALRFAVLYRERAGFPARHPPAETPDAYGLAWEPVAIPSHGAILPGWFIPASSVGAASRVGAASSPGPTPCVVLVHGWSSNRARMLPYAAFLHAAGFHTLAFDVRGHGENPEERLPISAAEFGTDTAAAVDVAGARPDVTSVGILGHSMGGAGAAIAAARRPRTRALVITSAPADPRLLVRETFRMARLPIPSPVAVPLAWVTAQLYSRPRGIGPGAASARRAVAAYGGPVLVAQGDADEIIPIRDLRILERAARGRSGADATTEMLVVSGGAHRWLYESEPYRRGVATFLVAALDGGRDPDAAAAAAAAVPIARPAGTDDPLIPERAVRGHTTTAA